MAPPPPQPWEILRRRLNRIPERAEAEPTAIAVAFREPSRVTIRPRASTPATSSPPTSSRTSSPPALSPSFLASPWARPPAFVPDALVLARQFTSPAWGPVAEGLGNEKNKNITTSGKYQGAGMFFQGSNQQSS
ncbi:unnamed protein product [Urochloa humidicola]